MNVVYMFIAVIPADHMDWVKLWRIVKVKKLGIHYLIPAKNEKSDKPVFDYAVLTNFMNIKGGSGSKIILLCHFKRVVWHPFAFKSL